MYADNEGFMYLEDTEPISPLNATINALQAATSDVVKSSTRIWPVENVTARNALVSKYPPTTARPLVVWRSDAAAGAQLEYTTDGTTWNPVIPPVYPTTQGFHFVSNTGLVGADGALTPVINIPSLPVPYRVIVQATGRSGGAASDRQVAWGFDSWPANATVDADNKPGNYRRVLAHGGQYATVSAQAHANVPAGVVCSFRVMSRANNNSFNSGSIVWTRTPQ